MRLNRSGGRRAATLLVTDFLFHNWLAVATAGVIALFAAWAWFVQPAIARRNGR